MVSGSTLKALVVLALGVFCSTIGLDIVTGPGLPVRSIVNALRMNSGTRSGRSMYPYHFDTDFIADVMSK